MKISSFKSLVLSIIVLLSSLSYASDMVCEEKYTSESPLLITDATGMDKKEYENFRESRIPSEDNVSHFITKRSIVRLIRQPGRGEDFLNVEVLGEAKYNEARAKGHFAENAFNKDLPQAVRGQKGFIHKSSLLPSDDFVFVVAKDSAFVALPSPYDEAKAFRIAKSGNNYKVNRCCRSDDAETCYDYPVFEVRLEGGWSEVGDDALNSRIYCGVTTDTRPIEKNQYEAVLNILAHPGLGLDAGLLDNGRTRANANDLYFVDSRGLVMLPHIPAERGVDLTEGPYGTFHFTGGGQDIQGDDAYLAPYAACGFMAVVREWNRRYPDCAGKGCGVTWGNCSHSTHVARVKGRWPSRTHGHGHCIDIRLFTTTSSSVGSSVTGRYYNRNRVVEFLQLARAAGATTIYLEDVRAARQVHQQNGRGFTPVLTRVPPHKDHMHVCFSHRSTDSRSSFADPTLPATNRRLKNLCEQDAKDAIAGVPSRLLGTEVVATAGVETPSVVIPLNVPIPRPRPRPEGLVAQSEPAADLSEIRPVARPETVEIKAAEENPNVVVSPAQGPAIIEAVPATPSVVEPVSEVTEQLDPIPAQEAVVAIPERVEPAKPSEVIVGVTPAQETEDQTTPALVTQEESNPEIPIPQSRPTADPSAIVVTDIAPPSEEVVAEPSEEPAQQESEPDAQPSDIVVTDLPPPTEESIPGPSEDSVQLESEPVAEPSAIVVTDLPAPTEEVIPIPAERPLQQESEPELMPQPENDPFAEKPGDFTVIDMIHEELSQDHLSEQEKEKYFEEELSEVVSSETQQVVEGDVVTDHNRPVPLEITPTDTSLSLERESPAPAADSGVVGTSESNISSSENSYLPSSRRPPRRYDNGRQPTGQEREDDVSQAVAGAYEPVTTPEESSGFSFFSIFTGIFEAIANLFRGLFGG